MFVIAAAIVDAREDGISGRTLKSGTNGCSCHGTKDTTTRVTISGPADVVTGQTAAYTITVNNTSKLGAGVDIAVRRGTLSASGGMLRLLNGELVHNYDLPMTSGEIQLQFSYTAPANPVTDTIFSTGNATNSNGANSGDAWNFGKNFRVNVIAPPKVLNLGALIEGLYDPSLNQMTPDTVRIQLRNTSSPYALVDEAKSVLGIAGTGTFSFNNAANGTPYYIVILHRNSIETWSNAGASFTGNSLSYDFTTSAGSAYGSNLKLIDNSPAKYAVYSGDVDQSDNIDVTDLGLIDNDVAGFVSGYVVTDVNGDGFVDVNDLLISDNNAYNFVSAITP